MSCKKYEVQVLCNCHQLSRRGRLLQAGRITYVVRVEKGG